VEILEGLPVTIETDKLQDEEDDEETSEGRITSITIALLVPMILATFTVITGAIVVTPFLLLGNDPISWLQSILGVLIPRKKKYWGIVYDKVKFKGIPFAVVRLYKDKVLIAQAVTDTKGRYGLLSDNVGTHTLEIKAQGFTTYKDEINIKKAKEVIKDIGMNRKEGKPNPILEIIYYSKPEILRLIQLVSLAAMIVGFFFTLYASYISPSIWNYLLLVGYFVLFVFNSVVLIKNRQRTLGRIVEEKTKETNTRSSDKNIFKRKKSNRGMHE